MKVLLFIVTSIFLSIHPLCAQKVQKVCGTYTYYAEGNESPNEARRKALEYAKLKAMADVFGTAISQSHVMKMSSENGKESNYYSSLTSTEVEGEWIEDVGEPEYKIEYVQNVLRVSCSVCGRARKISNESVDISAVILKNGTEAKYADVNFREGDDMYLSFRSPADGYVAVYLIDETPNAFCLLPYIGNSLGQQPVKHNEEYVFFAPGKSPVGSGEVDEFTMTCSKDIEQNQIYVIFSPKPFTKALDRQLSSTLPRQLSFEEFSHWLSSSRKRDPKMGVKVMHIEIRP